ncbi:protein draper-like [Mytilus californianus]|uniref:protein draper-like n=1 Tax=Mytilus californianus TaxID=6549 RepID=UPI00224831F3|nr:protein draper-like [Mytilus californianus]
MQNIDHFICFCIVIYFGRILTALLSNGEHVCSRQDGELYCCYNYVEIGSICKECPYGTFSDNGMTCELCPLNTYGRQCVDTCYCNASERCDSAIGCVPHRTESSNISKGAVTRENNDVFSGENTTESEYQTLPTHLFTGKILFYLVAICGVVILLLFCIIFLLLLKYRNKNKNERNQTVQINCDDIQRNQRDHSENDQNFYNEIDETLSFIDRNSYISVNDNSSVKSSIELANAGDDYLIPFHSGSPQFHIKCSVNQKITDTDFTNNINSVISSDDEEVDEDDMTSSSSKTVEHLASYQSLTEQTDVHDYERN